MKVNVVMLVKDRSRLTNQALSSLWRNTPNKEYNITIIDDDSLATGLLSQTVLGASAGQCTVLKIRGSKGITGQARNLGVYWAEKYWGRGEYLYLSDNDVYFTPKWMDALFSCFETVSKEEWHGYKLLGGWNHPYLQPKNEALKLFFRDYIYEHDAVAGASQLMRWETWDKYGPLDAHAPGVGQSEDWAMCQKIIKDGGKVGSIYPRVVLNCGLTNTLGEPSPGADLMLKELEEAKKTYPDLYWE